MADKKKETEREVTERVFNNFGLIESEKEEIGCLKESIAASKQTIKELEAKISQDIQDLKDGKYQTKLKNGN